MKNSFKSRDFFFRPTALSLALVAAGVAGAESFTVREPRREGLLRAKTDRFNNQASVRIAPIPSDVRPMSDSWKSSHKRMAAIANEAKLRMALAA